MRVLSDYGSVVIADVLVEGGNKHQRITQIMVDILAVELYALNAIIDKAVTRVMDEPYRVKKIMDHHRFENVQLEIPLRAGKPDSCIIAKHLHAHHRHRFRLRRI